MPHAVGMEALGAQGRHAGLRAGQSVPLGEHQLGFRNGFPGGHFPALIVRSRAPFMRVKTFAKRSRYPKLSLNNPATNRMAAKLSTPAGRAAYAERKWLSEAPNGWIKHVLGFRRFSLRGLAKVRGEWNLVCLALNAKRLHALMACNLRSPQRPPIGPQHGP